MGKLPPGSSLPVRNLPGPIATTQHEIQPTPRYVVDKLEEATRYLGVLYAAEVNRSNMVEEYAGESVESPTGETQLNVIPDFSPASECITQVLVTGPVTTAFVLQLGDRYMSMSTDATGKCLLSPVAMILKPTSNRQLTSATPGDWFLHLSGYALVRRNEVL
jgi:hypothetical protein